MSDSISSPAQRAPEPPIPPEDADCCRSGCDPCVFDRYAAAMERYRAELRAWEEQTAASSQTNAAKQ